MQDKIKIVKALAVTAEVMGTELSDAAAQVMCDDLSKWPVSVIISALDRTRREHTGRLTLSAIIQRIDDGRPGVEEAWAMCPQAEGDTAVWTDEVSAAFFAAVPLLYAGDRVGARMAFKEKYIALLSEARNEQRPVKYWVSLGHDVAGREGPINNAVAAGILTREAAVKLLPAVDDSPNLAQLADESVKFISAPELENGS